MLCYAACACMCSQSAGKVSINVSHQSYFKSILFFWAQYLAHHSGLPVVLCTLLWECMHHHCIFEFFLLPVLFLCVSLRLQQEEHITESLKNALLVMATADVLNACRYGKPPQSPAWLEVRKRISAFAPTLWQEVFPPEPTTKPAPSLASGSSASIASSEDTPSSPAVSHLAGSAGKQGAMSCDCTMLSPLEVGFNFIL